MPLPFIVAAGVAVAGIVGAGGHLCAKDTNEKAQKVAKEAQELYEYAKHSLEEKQLKTEKALVELGNAKMHVLDTSMKQFLTEYDKIKHIQFNDPVGIHEISKFTLDPQDAIQIREMTNIYSASFASGAAGVAAGTAVALAASGALPVITGELAMAGSALAAGEIGMAAGFAGSALSFGAVATPLAVVAAPVVLFTGISASMKADENLEKANVMRAEAECAVEEMRTKEVLSDAITKKSEMFYDLLRDLNVMFSECSGLLAGVVRKKEGTILKKTLTSADFTEDEIKLISVTRSLAGAVKTVINTPILSKDGSISFESNKVYEDTVEALPTLNYDVNTVKSINFKAKPIKVKNKKSSSQAVSGTTVMSASRNIAAIVIGVILATFFAGNIAYHITNGQYMFLFISSLSANVIAVWLFLFSSVTMLIGKFNGRKTEKLCSIVSGLSLSILYVQYCRTAEQMDHYIIFSLVFFLVFVILFCVFSVIDKWSSRDFFLGEALVMAFWPLAFLVYALLCKLLWFSEGFCLVVTSVLMCLISCVGMYAVVSDKNPE